MWSAEELQQLLDELVGGQDPAVVASSVSSALRVPIPVRKRVSIPTPSISSKTSPDSHF